ncbi:transposase, partial [Leptothoe sp. PORK10 BA2]|uniref:transposase n=1 Tax=Leptothoe sp. PORK10 BA2 TaxID=3110254 RepID=UPI002B1EC6A7
AKRRFGLGRVMAKLAQTAETMIAITFLVMNLEQRLRRFIFWLLRCWVHLEHSAIQPWLQETHHTWEPIANALIKCDNLCLTD